MKVIKAVLGSFSLLTIIPLGRKSQVSEENLRSSLIFFPLVGFFLGAVSSFSVNALYSVFSKEVCVLIYLVVLTLFTGGFHLDGLSDTFDGFSVKSTGNRSEDIKKRLSVMSSGTQGPLGSLSVLFVIAFKFFLLKDVFRFKSWWVFFALLPVFSRCCVVVCMYYGKSAKNEGLGSLFVGKIKKSAPFICIVEGLFLCLCMVKDMHTFLYLAFAFGVVCFCGILFTLMFQRRFGGLTGDTLGAIIELSEVVFLMVLQFC